LEASSPDGRLLGLDADRAAILETELVLAQYGDRVVLRQANFEAIYDVANEAGFVPLDAVLFDLGLSSYQLADPQRGFSFAADAPPDMRFDEDRGLSALDLIDRSSQRELAGILATFGEERRAGRIATAILAARAQGRLVTAADLSAVVTAAVPASRADAGRIHPATRTFQALRIAVNDELGELERGLAAAEQVLAPGGRLAVVSFHSLEDRAVKEFVRARAGRTPGPSRHAPPRADAEAAKLRDLTRKPVLPSAAEIAANPRARSARLRVAEKIANEQGGRA
jgi:16S rRNA (cytosine1402-N4)-methyltransferase